MNDQPQEPTNEPIHQEPEDIFADVREVPDPDAVPAERVMDLGDTTDITDHSVEEAVKESRNKELGVHVPTKPETLQAPLTNPVMTDEAAGEEARLAAEAAFRDEIDRIKIEVTDEEKTRFIRAALHDTEMIFDIPLEGLDMVVSVAMPSEAFTSAAEMIVLRWGKDGHIDAESRLQFTVAFQQVHLWHQIRAINGQTVPWAWDGTPTLSEIKAFAFNYENLSDVINWSSTKHRLLMRASMIAETKYRICMTNLHDRTFFTGAATA